MDNQNMTAFKNHFGMIKDQMLTLNHKNGTEEIPITKVTSVGFEHHRSLFFGIGGLAIGFIGAYMMAFEFQHLGGTEVLTGTLFLLIAILGGIANLIGHHEIRISVSGNDRKPIKVEMSKTKEGVEFVSALRKAILK
jgi:hypothetical protein